MTSQLFRKALSAPLLVGCLLLLNYSVQAQQPSYIAATDLGASPKKLDCFPNVQTKGVRTFPLTYRFNWNGKDITRNMKAGIQYSYSCNGFWGVYEGPIDSILSLEAKDGTFLLNRGSIRRYGSVSSNVIKDFSGEVRACIAPPFNSKYCSTYTQVNF